MIKHFFIFKNYPQFFSGNFFHLIFLKCPGFFYLHDPKDNQKKFSALDWLRLFITGYRYPSTHNCAMCRYHWPVSVPVQQHDVHDGGAGEHGRCPPLHGPTSAPEIFREVLGEQSSSAQAEVVVNYEQWGFQPFLTLLKGTVNEMLDLLYFIF